MTLGQEIFHQSLYLLYTRIPGTLPRYGVCSIFLSAGSDPLLLTVLHTAPSAEFKVGIIDMEKGGLDLLVGGFVVQIDAQSVQDCIL